jgi:uncharacterized membrane protein YeaQ/YmgE (transglycosylase-associated protein family)
MLIMEPMGLLAWIIVGLIAGWLASQVVPSRLGTIGDTILGMIGALVGGFLFEELGASGASGLNIWSIFVAFIGAAVLLLLIRMVSGRKRFLQA